MPLPMIGFFLVVLGLGFLALSLPAKTRWFRVAMYCLCAGCSIAAIALIVIDNHPYQFD